MEQPRKKESVRTPITGEERIKDMRLTKVWQLRFLLRNALAKKGIKQKFRILSFVNKGETWVSRVILADATETEIEGNMSDFSEENQIKRPIPKT